VALAQNNVIGGNNQLLWHLPADLRYFKELTTGHVVIMGRKTFDSIGKVLPNRIFVVISSRATGLPAEVHRATSLAQALEQAHSLTSSEIFVIGGGQIYKQALPLAHKLYITEVKARFEGDTVFPEIDKNIWQENSRVKHFSDEKNNYNYDFVTYLRQ
jgi:dihydrofolate reductase